MQFISLFHSVILGVLLGVLLPRRNSNSNNAGTFEELPESSKWYGDEEIRIFRQYLSFPTMPPNIDYGIDVLKRIL